MRWYKADLHIHTVLSPCGDLDMSPVNIIRQANLKKLDIIAVTDHNSTRHCRITAHIGKRYGIKVLAGAELNTKEEVHCLAIFENADIADVFQEVIDLNLLPVPNDPEIFGHQFIVDEEENILDEEVRLLVASLQLSVDELSDQVKRLGGLFIPAHIDRHHNGIYSQLGFLPPALKVDALEVSRRSGFKQFLEAHPEVHRHGVITNSDAHTISRIGESITEYYLGDTGIEEIRLALHTQNGRKLKTT